MGVKKTGEKYRCNVCGNEVTVTKVGGGELVCCGQPMEKIENK
jgi:desulfoferrodoxin-like iron-binding protein